MPALSAQIVERSRKNASALLRALADAGQVRVADLLGVSESTVSRMKDTDIDRLAQLAAACGLKLVAEDAHVFAPKRIAALQELARIGLEHAGTPSEFGEFN
jgi:hypothetical protein